MNVTDARDASLHLFDDYAIVTAMDLRSGKFYADRVVEQKYVKPVRDPASNPPPPGRSSDGAAADLFVRLGIPKVIGEYLVTGVLLNRVSNRIAVKVGPPELAGSDERFDQALSKHHEAGLKSDSTATNLIFNSGMEGPGSPVIIKESGIEISANPVSDLKQEKGPVMLEGSFRLPVGKKTPSLVSKGPAESDAFSITILATGSRLPKPLVYKFDIQFKHDPGGANSYILARSFSIDLNQLGWMEGGQTYSVYAFAGTAVSVPVNIQISKSILK